MKKLLLLLFILSGFQSFAIWNKGMLRIREERGRSISVSIDGMRYNKIGRTVTIPNLTPGRHMVKVFAYNSNGHGYRTGILLYQGMIDIKPGTIHYGTVIRRGMDVEENCCINDYGQWNNNDNWDDWDTETETWNNNHRWNDRDRYEQWNRNNEDPEWNNYNGKLSIGRYNQLIEQIRNSSFESSKSNVINNALRNTTLTVNQLIGILRELSFESTKLQLAKDHYTKLLDNRNAFMINDVFTFQSSKDEFLEFLNRQGR